MDPLLEIAGALLTGVFGWGAAWAGMRGKVNAAEERSTTAIQQANTCLSREAGLDKRLSVLEVEVRHVREQSEQMVTQDGLRAVTATQTSELRRLISRTMPAVRREEDSEPPSGALPPMRGRLPSRRDP